jgi:hypothetical protein
VKSDASDDNPCKNGASCAVRDQKLVCTCTSGFSGDLCVDREPSRQCDAASEIAVDDDLDGTPDRCLCKDGYRARSDGLGCDDIDECAIDNGGCGSEASCKNGPGGHSCDRCPTG